jgi:Uma2 family endonuclease
MSSAATFTIDEYQHMIACGAFVGPREKRLELIRGVLRMMSPQGAEHGEVVAKLNDWSHDAVDRQRVKIRVQSSVEIPASDSQPEPDLVWAEPRPYARQLPGPRDILLLIEVADSSLSFDLREKRQLYCDAGIRDYWVIDIPGRAVHVFRDPCREGYRTHQTYSVSDEASVVPLLVDNVSLSLSSLFTCLDV